MELGGTKIKGRKCSSGKVPASADPKMLLPSKIQSRSQFKTFIDRSVKDDPIRAKVIEDKLADLRRKHND